jgi:hypothetical protein
MVTRKKVNAGAAKEYMDAHSLFCTASGLSTQKPVTPSTVYVELPTRPSIKVNLSYASLSSISMASALVHQSSASSASPFSSSSSASSSSLQSHLLGSAFQTPLTSPIPAAAPEPPSAAPPGFSLAAPPKGFVDDPYPVYAALRAHSPVHTLAPGQWLLTRHADVLAAYRHPALMSDKRAEFAPRLGVGTPIFEHHTTSLVFSDPPRHTRVRRLLMGALNQRAIARMEAPLAAQVQQLLDGLAGQAVPDLIEHFAAQIPVEVIGNLLAIPPAERAPLREWSLAILSALEPAPPAAVLARANAAVDEFCGALRQLVAERRRHPGDRRPVQHLHEHGGDQHVHLGPGQVALQGCDGRQSQHADLRAFHQAWQPDSRGPSPLDPRAARQCFRGRNRAPH